MELVDAIEIVLKLARDRINYLNAIAIPSESSSALARDAINTLEDFAVNHLGDE